MLKTTLLATFSQELIEKLEVVGRLDALLINPPQVVTENNPHLEKHLLGWYVLASLVPPGKHTLIVHYQGSYYFRNILVDGCKYDVLPVAADNLPPQKTANLLGDWQPETHQDFEFQFASLVNSWQVEIPVFFGF